MGTYFDHIVYDDDLCKYTKTITHIVCNDKNLSDFKNTVLEAITKKSNLLETYTQKQIEEEIEKLQLKEWERYTILGFNVILQKN